MHWLGILCQKLHSAILAAHGIASHNIIQQYFSTCHIIKVCFLRLILSPTSYRAILLHDSGDDSRS
jgi:hypothetical protein